MSGVNLYEQAIQPVVDLDADVIVYVPGYANKGPSEPTQVTANNFTALFGDSPYLFKDVQAGDILKNNTFAGRPEKSWLYAKGLVDAGLTVLYHRVNPRSIGIASTSVNSLSITELAASTGVPTVVSNKSFSAQAKNFGSYYNGMVVKFILPSVLLGNLTVSVLSNNTAQATVLESYIVSFDPSKSNFIGNIQFAYVDFYTGDPNAAGGSTQVFGFSELALDSYLALNSDKKLYAKTTDAAGDVLTLSVVGDEFTVKAMEQLLSGKKLNPDYDPETPGSEEFIAGESPASVLLDTNRYQSVTYLTSGGYYQPDIAAADMHSIGWQIKAAVATDLGDNVTIDTFAAFQARLMNISSTAVAKSKAFAFVGADTYVINGYRVVMPDSFGYLQKLGSNLSQAIPAWIPVANNPQGVVSAVATTRPVDRALQDTMISKEGISVNPVIFKQNAGYCVMGNRTCYVNDGVLGPQSFLNCVLVVNSVERAARRAANDLLIVSTNPQTAFSSFKRAVSKTCDKMLVNQDGLIKYSIMKLKKTMPATLDIAIALTVVEGIEEMNVTIPISLQLD